MHCLYFIATVKSAGHSELMIIIVLLFVTLIA